MSWYKTFFHYNFDSLSRLYKQVDMIQLKQILKTRSKCKLLTEMSVWNFALVKFKLPDLGEKIKEGTIKKLYISEGDTVAEFQKLADVASDKQFTEITATDAGVIKKIHFQEEEVCQVGELFLEIQTEAGDKSTSASSAPTAQSTSGASKPSETKSQRKSMACGYALATPFVRKLATDNGIDLETIKGSGENGRVLEKDVHNYSQKPKPQTTTTVQPVSSKSSQRVSMNNFQKGMQKSMTQSNTIPHLYLNEQIDITQSQELRATLKKSNLKVTIMGILIKTFSMALRKHPKVNSLYQPQQDPYSYQVHPSHNISIAIDSPNGLLVPNIKNVQNLSLVEIQNQIERLRNMANQGRLGGSELNGGTSCLSNVGTIGGTHACPLILPPQVCIVAIGKLQTVPRYINSELIARSIINVTLGCDHRILDGATVARFANDWKTLLENPYLAMSEMI